MEKQYGYPEMPQEFWELNYRDCPIKLPSANDFFDKGSPSYWDDVLTCNKWLKDPCYDLPEELMPFQIAHQKAKLEIRKWGMAERVRIEGLWIAQINLWVDYYERNTPNSFFDHQSDPL